MAKKDTAEAPAPATTLYRVRDGFHLFPRDGGEPVEPGTLVEFTAEEAEYHAHQIELADPDDIAAAEAAEAEAAAAAAQA